MMNESSGERPIWIVEDSVADVELVRYAFEQHGVTADLRVFSNGEAAMLKIDEIDGDQSRSNCCQPRLALLDINLPRRSGLEVLKRIRQSAVLSNLPVVIFTSSEAERERAMTGDLRAQEYILKGLDLDQFGDVGAVVKRLLVANQAP